MLEILYFNIYSASICITIFDGIVITISEQILFEPDIK